MIGKMLGHYQITSQLGKGGMGEVYQAKDQKLGRDVAIKVLPEEFARDADRVARFQREAKLLASLNHTNIAAIYGLEESGGTNFLVLELVEGDTLADRIKSGPVRVEEALKLALQIAEALEAAHEKGVIHRDLKPANLKVTPEGKVKVLDFGLAKAFAGEQANLNLSNSPTLSDAATQQGVILGTAAYMSPEQARGKALDKKADIWAFGCVLYEMLTGQAAFQGEDVTEILASVVKGGANLDLLPADVHPRVREALIRCLQKDLRRRYPDIADARYEIEQAMSDPGGWLARPITTAEPRRKLRTLLPWIAAMLGMVLCGLAVWNLRKPGTPQVTRFSHELPKDQQLGDIYESALAVSPDGRQFVYSTKGELYLRSMTELDARPIPGTGGAKRPFFSPDGKWIGYWSATDRQLKKIAVSGGTPVAIADAPALESFSWGEDNAILYGQPGKGIMRVSAEGGPPENIVKQENEWLLSPQMLPDGKSVLFTRSDTEPKKIMAQSLHSGERRDLVEGNTARYLRTGHLVYGFKDNLYVVPFDLKGLKVAGRPVRLVEGVVNMGPTPQYDVSASGTLAYVPGTSTAIGLPRRTLLWVDRNGREEPVGAPENAYYCPRVSPDGKKVASGFTASGSQELDIWIWDLLRKTLTRLTSEDGQDNWPVWTLGGKRIAYAITRGTRGDKTGIYWKAADGTGEKELLASPWLPNSLILPHSWSADGKSLALTEYFFGYLPASDIGLLSTEGDRGLKRLLSEKHNETQPNISPDGRRMAYTSDESGQTQVYVRPFPDVNSGGRLQISTSGGDSPLWSPDGRELYYRSGDTVMAVSLKSDPAFSAEAPRLLFRGSYVSYRFTFMDPELNPWDISPDGKRFLMMKESGPDAPAAAGLRRINVVLNWTEELKQRVPVK
jgi:serine/threonine-protein kinase